MTCAPRKLLISICFCAAFLLVSAEELKTDPSASVIISKKTIDELGITEVILDNGLRLCFKPTAYEEDEVLIRLTAEGGYAALSPAQRAAGELAAEMAWESGLEGMTTDQLTALIYAHSIELYAKILPYHRIIEGTTDKGGVELFFDLVKRYSLQKHFTREGFDKIVKKTKEFLRHREASRCSAKEEWMRAVHTQDVGVLNPLTLKDLDTMEFDQVKQFLEGYFFNPADFTCVIVGHFDLDEILSLACKYLGDVPRKERTTPMQAGSSPAFAEGVTKKRICSKDSESHARLTFPLAPLKSSKEMRTAKLMALIMETRLREKEKSHELTVSLELPLYPSLDLTWLAIQYRASPQQVEAMETIILNEIKQLATKGTTEAELAASWALMRQREALWDKDNQYWLSLLSDYCVHEWPWSELSMTLNANEQPTADQFLKAMGALLNTENYSFIYSSG